MSLSIIIPAHNEAGQIERTLESVLNNGLDFQNTEIVVVGSDCTDDTMCIAEQVLEQDERVRESQLLESGRGKQIAQNIGVAVARGSSIVCHDADVITDTGTFSLMYETLENRPEVKLVGSLIIANVDELPTSSSVLAKVVHSSDIIRRGCLGVRKSVSGGCFGFSTNDGVVFPNSATPDDLWISADIADRYGLEAIEIFMRKRTHATPAQNWHDYIARKSRDSAGFRLLETEFPELAYTVRYVTDYIESNRSSIEIDRRWAEECSNNGINLEELLPAIDMVGLIVKNQQQQTVDDLVNRAGTWEVLKSTKSGALQPVK